MFRNIVWATLVAGTLDILFAFVISGAVEPVLRTVASGPFGDAIPDGLLGALLGLLVHFAIMAVMATTFFVVALKLPALNRYWWLAGPSYGVVLWLVMYWLVMPLRWDSYTTPSEPTAIVQQLFAHCLLVGLPIVWFARRHVAIRPSFN
jgi:hypothetical protein